MKKVLPLIAAASYAALMMSCQIVSPPPTEDPLSSSVIAEGDSTIVSSATALSSATTLSSSPFDTIIISFSSAELSSSSEVVTPDTTLLSSSVITLPDTIILSSSSVIPDTIPLSSSAPTISSSTIVPDTIFSSSEAVSSSEIASSSETMSSSETISSSEVASSSSVAPVVDPLPAAIDTTLIEATEALTSPGTATTNSEYGSYPAWKAFDKEPGFTPWISDHDFRPGTGPANLMYLFDYKKTVVEYRIQGRFDSLKDRLPKSWIIQGTNSDAATANDALTDGAWTTIDTQNDITVGEEWQSTGITATTAYTVANPAPYTAYRICVTEVNGSSVVDIHELFLLEKGIEDITIHTTADDNRTSSTALYSSAYPAWKLFDGASNWTQWMSAHVFRPGTGPANVAYNFDDATVVREYTLRGRYDTLKDRLPKNWILQGSNAATAIATDALDSDTWTTIDTRTDMEIGGAWNSDTNTASMTLEVQSPGDYTTYRICITAVNGSSIADLIELSFAGSPAP
ncbi:MAG: hypothetical protein OCD01_10680 [Fibrobacterales bacterium]